MNFSDPIQTFYDRFWSLKGHIRARTVYYTVMLGTVGTTGTHRKVLILFIRKTAKKTQLSLIILAPISTLKDEDDTRTKKNLIPIRHGEICQER